ncbi:DUF4253 domain-containing protein [Nocardiopsis sp. EMB25]|uniref:DUF4253 domain-containing protein n=1 Tax=Nocardiopsis sp. EMB25 TaxID=2835867 RepID=UPI0022836C2E|nr:DUF4253 domain-containing protein [Nocardiopsis sp. EMB25]MCY9784190.1 DUF4253 domain-containing protein [Nocardiopsis sp. EMB25]
MDPQACLSVPLPSGRMLSSHAGDPLLWVSDEPVPVGLWPRLLAESPRSGWWPLLLEDFDRYRDRFREAPTLKRFTPLTDHDPAELLAGWWAGYTGPFDPDLGETEPRPNVTAPFGADWPGTVPAASLPEGAAEDEAAECADLLVEHVSGQRLGLVRASSGAQALIACGWSGPLNYDNDTAVFAAVVADWQHRFGARVLGLGFDTLTLSVAAPPADTEQALRVAAEHFAFCPDQIWQGHAHRLRDYAERLVDRPVWTFWWD